MPINSLCLNELLTPLQQLFVSPCFKKLKESSTKASKACHEILFDEKFWDNVTHILTIVKPIIWMLRLVDGPFPMQTLIAHLKNIEEDEYIRAELVQFASTRWMEYHSSLHAAASLIQNFKEAIKKVRCLLCKDGMKY